jgi:hypothetical protein
MNCLRSLERWDRGFHPTQAWISVCACSVSMLSCVQAEALRWADPPSKESYRLYIGLRNWKSSRDPRKDCRAIDRQCRWKWGGRARNACSAICYTSKCHLHKFTNFGPRRLDHVEARNSNELLCIFGQHWIDAWGIKFKFKYWLWTTEVVEYAQISLDRQ